VTAPSVGPTRQQILYLWLAESALDSEVVAWAFHDGASGRGERIPSDDPPYATGVAALEDGWRLLQTPHVAMPPRGQETDPAYLGYEFVFERRVVVQPGTGGAGHADGPR
jgi:hypothetical protein